MVGESHTGRGFAKFSYNNREEKILAMQKRYDQYIDNKGYKRKKALDLLVDEFRPWKKNTIIKYLKIPILQK